jgi:hypothetical protein
LGLVASLFSTIHKIVSGTASSWWTKWTLRFLFPSRVAVPFSTAALSPSYSSQAFGLGVPGRVSNQVITHGKNKKK